MENVELRAIDAIQEKWGLVNMGWGAFREIVGPEREEEIRNIKMMITGIGEDGRLTLDSDNRWEKIGYGFAQYVGQEAMGWDLKATNELPSEEEIAEVINQHEWEGKKVVISKGCPSSPNDHRLDRMLTVTIYKNGQVISQAHISPVLEDDRRYSEQPDVMNRLQYIVKLHDGRLYDLATHKEVVDKTILRDKMPSLVDGKTSNAKLITYLGRNLLNYVRGFQYTNRWNDGEELFPQIATSEAIEILVVAANIPYLLMRNEIDLNTIDEFRYRMMASFLINPKLFTNLAANLDLNSAFPFFDSYAQDNKTLFETFEIPRSTDEMISTVREIMNGKYNEKLSFLGNVARIFAIGMFGWEDESIYLM